MKNLDTQPVNLESFEEELYSGRKGAEQFMDLEAPFRTDYIAQQYEKRSRRNRAHGPDDVFSSIFVFQQAAERYYPLIDDAVFSMSGIFSEWEMTRLLNTTCGPIWSHQAGTSLAGHVADDMGVEEMDDLEDGSDLKVLLIKLIKLTPLQTAALVDLCERFWRGPMQGSLTEMFEKMGLELTE